MRVNKSTEIHKIYTKRVLLVCMINLYCMGMNSVLKGLIGSKNLRVGCTQRNHCTPFVTIKNDLLNSVVFVPIGLCDEPIYLLLI